MRAVIQRVSHSSLSIKGATHAHIGKGFLVLLGIEEADTSDDVQWLSNKIVGLRIFNDSDEKMNLSLSDIQGEILLVSQFTLFASTLKGNRPSFIKAARPEKAIPLYEEFILQLKKTLPEKVQTGVFGADMQIELLNDGPVTILIDSKAKE